MELGPIQKEWIKTLREHPERQLKESLGYIDGDNIKMCCLGQLLYCVKGIKCLDNKGIVNDDSYDERLTFSFKELGLRSDIGESNHKNHNSLVRMNDGEKTWPEIADKVEANPEGYFTKSY